MSHPTKLKPRPLRKLGQNNGVRLRSEPPTIAGAGAMGSRPTPISRAVGCSLMSRGSDAAALVAVMLGKLLQTRIHYRYRCCVAMPSRAETQYRCLRCARRSRAWIDPRPGSFYI